MASVGAFVGCGSSLGFVRRRAQSHQPPKASSSFVEQAEQSQDATLVPDPVRVWILGDGGATTINRVTSIGDGHLNSVKRFDTDAGSFFVKSNRSVGVSTFEGEAAGLNAMLQTNTIRVPKPFKVGELDGGGSFIVMECIDFNVTSATGQEDLGRALGEMHKAGSSSGNGFGFPVVNSIGSTPQENSWTPDWISFFRDSRIRPQLELIRERYQDEELYESGMKMLEKIPSILRDADVKPCLIHGDLWTGNFSFDRENNPVIFDPACYYGHNEAEFGMTWSSCFSESFYKAYFQVMPKRRGMEDRVPLYKLYHFLNHYNMFGKKHRKHCNSIIRWYNNNKKL